MSYQLVYWQNTPSIHQAPLISAMSAHSDCEVALVTVDNVPEHRKHMGWERPDFGAAEVYISPPRCEWKKLIDEFSGDHRIHILSGIQSYPMLCKVLRRLLQRGERCGIFAEPGRTSDWKVFLRRWYYRYQGKRWGRKLDFILATGDLGMQWYRQAWFPEEKIFSFGYFVARRKGNGKEDTKARSQPFRLAYIGGLTDRKWVEGLILACRWVPRSKDWELEIIGDGPTRDHLQSVAQAVGLGDRIYWHGNLPNENARSIMGAVDLLVLPSWFDGWGAVVNEALMEGTRVVCSDACGAATLIHASGYGEVFPSGNMDALAASLARAIERGPTDAIERREIRQWSACITGSKAANYLFSIFDNIYGGAERPTPPWAVPVIDKV